MKKWMLGKLAYKFFKPEAKEYLKDKDKTFQLLSKAEKKAIGNKLTLTSIWHKLQTTFQLLKYWLTGQYKDVPYRTLITMVVGIVYFVSPIDLVPDFIAGFGLVDDAAVLGVLLSQIDPDLARFLEWKKTRDNTIDAQ
ncbi:YkvA family protein [Falsibacillus albus]|uniref:DUF1232 domain-containing protein n=1 Tax=Falsibacillus albus TaxID=2478915 RepID=A0A3L7K8X5_9BACI|nr:YkvA family protein [Falsibacillus albus]RLQ97102.1 DUF1232 domain-containing protein [Falsibacillus albus]